MASPRPRFRYGDEVATPAEDTGHIVGARLVDGGYVYEVAPDRPDAATYRWAEAELTGKAA